MDRQWFGDQGRDQLWPMAPAAGAALGWRRQNHFARKNDDGHEVCDGCFRGVGRGAGRGVNPRPRRTTPSCGPPTSSTSRQGSPSGSTPPAPATATSERCAERGGATRARRAAHRSFTHEGGNIDLAADGDGHIAGPRARVPAPDLAPGSHPFPPRAEYATRKASVHCVPRPSAADRNSHISAIDDSQLKQRGFDLGAPLGAEEASEAGGRKASSGRRNRRVREPRASCRYRPDRKRPRRRGRRPRSLRHRAPLWLHSQTLSSPPIAPPSTHELGGTGN